MTTSLRVLVVESERGAADVAIDELESAGHTVARCTDASAPAFPCVAIQNGTCPLDADPPVDVVLAVRRHARSQPAPGEAGVSCSLQHCVPLVVAGGTALNPFTDWATEIHSEPFDVVPACERAARSPLAAHTQAAALALQNVVEAHGFDRGAALVAVYRRRGRLAVEVRGSTDLPKDVKAMAGVRMVAAIRELDRHARGIDVTFEH